MNPLAVTPVQEDRRHQYRDREYKEDGRKASDTKVKVFAKKISGSPGSLFASATAPKVILMSESAAQGRQDIYILPKKPKIKKRENILTMNELDEEPIGLHSCEPHSWINALMQLILRLPVFQTILVVSAPLSFEPFRVFIDQYNEDRRARLSVSSASGNELIRCLKKLLPNFFSSNSIDLFAVMQEIFMTAYPSGSLPYEMGRTHPDHCQFEWNSEEISLQHLVKKQQAADRAPADMVVSAKGKSEVKLCRLIPKQIFDLGDSFYYDLQGFIESRRDHSHSEWIAYIKILGKWYQCRSERVHKLCSTNLNLPLLSSHLLHYKKCHLSTRR
ncbi:MAG: hypothetical protein JSS32_09830 [Verrucomicrobia bacterium]|nr:hypothetical protein [Verrucomicrobiota bacterium]